ncbi:ACT domain-containing protein [Vermiculatibacterium agrestimuris]|uniref:ACT domain-containing protein n=1 Tax=Vermiculatibacterium agrestimuris TaxID=2941519 RepID=UPI002040E3FE|nr:ACT domain-containing protein [Vermiculatibacterium agrestimuris]
MGTRSQYFIVEAAALPEIFLKVAEAKRLLEVGEAQTVNEAAQSVGISRSAFYKYKDAVRPFNDMGSGRIVTFQILLKNEPGVLSAVLNSFARCGANILTINQGVPAGGSAVVNIGAETSGLVMTIEEMLSRVAVETGVVRCEILAG